MVLRRMDKATAKTEANRAKAEKRHPQTAFRGSKMAVCDSSPTPTWVNLTPQKPDLLLHEAFLAFANCQWPFSPLNI